MTEELLRRALSAEAESVEVSPDALERIRGRIRRRQARWWLPRPDRLRLVGIGALATAAVLAAVVAGLGILAPHRPATGPPGGTGGQSQGGRPVATANLPVYYLGPAADGYRLYREYHQVPIGGGSLGQRVEAAVGAMLGVKPADPDYTSPWPGGARVAGVSVDGATITVDISGAASAGAGGPGGGPAPGVAPMALQQLVWTATAASVVNGSTGLGAVLLRLDGRTATALWGAPVPAGPLHRSAAVDVLAPVWVIDPQQDTVQGRSFEIHLAGIVPEATMRLRIRDAAGAVHSDQGVHLTVGAPQVGTASVRVALDPGSYTAEGYVVSQRDGTEQWLDSHRFTVR